MGNNQSPQELTRRGGHSFSRKQDPQVSHGGYPVLLAQPLLAKQLENLLLCLQTEKYTAEVGLVH